MTRSARNFAVLLVALWSCKVSDDLYCDPERPCTDPARPYCDLNGEYPASGGIGRTCIADPFGADGGTVTSDAGIGAACTETICENDQVRVCGTSGTVDRVEECLLGCASDEARCSLPIASNGVTPLLEASLDLDALVLAHGSTVDADEGVVRSPQGDTIPVATSIVAQLDGPMLCVFVAGSWTLGDTRVRGQLPVAFVSAGDIVITGVVDGSADGAMAGPGALTCSEKTGGGFSFPIGAYSRHTFGPLYPTFVRATNGSGGGGWGTAGGNGGSIPVFEDRVAVVVDPSRGRPSFQSVEDARAARRIWPIEEAAAARSSS